MWTEQVNKLSGLAVALAFLLGANAVGVAPAVAADAQTDSVGLYLPGSELNALNAKPAFIGATSQKLFSLAGDTLISYDRQTGLTTEILHGYRIPDWQLPFATLNGRLFFNAYEPGFGQEVYVSDGTTAGTSLFKDILTGSAESQPSNFTKFGNLLIFSTKNLANNAYELWRTDGDPDPTHTFKITNLASLSSNRTAILGSFLYFEATGEGKDSNGNWKTNAVWRTDGSTASEVTTFASINGGGLASFQGKIYFNGLTSAQGNELWRTDGTLTELAVDINPTAANSSWSEPSYLTVLGDALYFSANDGLHGQELMKFDGTSVTLVKDELVGLSESRPWNITAFNGKLYYSALDATNSLELYSSDGTEAGTGLLMDVLPGVSVCNEMWHECGPMFTPTSLQSDPRLFTEFDGKLLFAASGANGSGNLWAITPPIVTPASPAPSDNAQISPPAPPAAVFDFAAQPRVAARGGELTLTGQNMDGINLVRFGELDAEIVERTNLYIKVRSPKLVAGIHNIYVSGSTGSLTWQDALTVAQSPVALECKAGHTARVSKRSAIIKATKLCAELLVKYPELTTSIRVVSSKSATLKANYFF